MTNEEREACADLFYTLTGGDNSMPAHRWNDAAAIELYEMIRVLKDCTQGMEWIKSLPKLIPHKGIPSSAISVSKYLLGIWRTKISIEAKIGAGKMSPVCQNSHTRRHRDRILIIAYGLGV